VHDGGRYDAAMKTWSWRSRTPQGPMRSTYVLQDADTSLETCWLEGTDGKETQCCEITRKRARAAPVVEAAIAKVAPAREHTLLHEDVGDWDR